MIGVLSHQPSLRLFAGHTIPRMISCLERLQLPLPFDCDVDVCSLECGGCSIMHVFLDYQPSAFMC